MMLMLSLALSVMFVQSCSQPSSGRQNEANGKTPNSSNEPAAQSSSPPAAAARSPSAKPAADRHEMMDDRLGAPDGFAAAVLYASDISGSLDVCGCSMTPLGGVARRQGYINEFEKRYPGVPYLHVDLGHFFSERTKFGTTNLLASVKVGNEWVVRAYEAMHVAALNVSFRDLLQLKHTFATDVYWKQHSEHPIFDRVISANVRAKSNGYVNPRPYLIETLRGGPLKRGLKIGLVGLTEAGTLPQDNYTIEDPLQAAQRVIPEVRAKSDLVVVLGYLNRPMAQRLATSGVGIDALLVAFRYPQTQPIRHFGKTLMATSIYEGRLLGELRIYLDERGRLSRLSNRYVSLDKVVPNDPKLAALRDEAPKAMAAAEMAKSSK
jgi:2',3'-cyclic-nucleotide 2'-phosphodiesterase (5'-nucleotidase family)